MTRGGLCMYGLQGLWFSVNTVQLTTLWGGFSREWRCSRLKPLLRTDGIGRYLNSVGFSVP